MAPVKHRKFTEISFLQHFEGHLDLLENFVALWGKDALGLEGELSIDSIVEYLTAPPSDNAAYDAMLKVLHEVNDFCIPTGAHAMREAEDMDGVAIDPDNELHLEAHALKLRTEYPKTFELAQDMWVTSSPWHPLRGYGLRPMSL